MQPFPIISMSRFLKTDKTTFLFLHLQVVMKSFASHSVIHINAKHNIVPREGSEYLNLGWQPVLQVLPQCQ